MYSSLQDFFNNAQKAVATEEEADVENTECIATLDSSWGLCEIVNAAIHDDFGRKTGIEIRLYLWAESEWENEINESFHICAY